MLPGSDRRDGGFRGGKSRDGGFQILLPCDPLEQMIPPFPEKIVERWFQPDPGTHDPFGGRSGKA